MGTGTVYLTEYKWWCFRGYNLFRRIWKEIKGLVFTIENVEYKQINFFNLLKLKMNIV